MNLFKRKNLLLALGFVIAALSTFQVKSTDDFKNVDIKTVKVKDGIYMLLGRGGNIGVSVGDDGVFLIDDQFAPLTEKIKSAIADITNKPIRFLINTHWHFDHTGGNENLGKEGVVIVAHHNVYERMSIDHFHTVLQMEIPASQAVALPVITFNDEVKFHLNGDHIHASHYQNAHTDGDSIVRFEKANVIHTGDVFFNGMYPLIDSYSNGTLEGVIRTVQELLNQIDDKTKIIPGHGPLANKVDLQNYLELLITIRDRMQKLIDEGKSLDEVIELQPYSDLDEKYGKGVIPPEAYPAIIYELLSSK